MNDLEWWLCYGACLSVFYGVFRLILKVTSK